MQARTRSINQATAMKLNSILILPGIFMIAIMGIFPAAAQPVKVEYREETELVAVVARLAGVSGYTWEEEETGVYDYFIDVDSTFAPFRNHKLIPFVREKLYGEGFNWHFPMHIAMRISIGEDGKITYDNSLEKGFDGYYDRITRRNEKKFLRLLEDFNRESGFHEFFLSHKALYSECEAAMREVVGKIDFSWYKDFFGKEEGSTFRICPGLLCGPGNYAVHQRGRDGSDIVNAIMGCCDRREDGSICYGIEYTLPVIIHEFCHSFCDPLNQEYWDSIKDAAESFFAENAEFYDSIAYGHPILVMNETFVEACVITYLKSHPLLFEGETLESYREYFGMGEASAEEVFRKYLELLVEIDYSKKKFLMIKDVIGVLEDRENNPEKYPAVADLMSEYSRVVNSFGKQE